MRIVHNCKQAAENAAQYLQAAFLNRKRSV